MRVPIAFILVGNLCSGCGPDLNAVAIGACKPAASNQDADQDGFTISEGDCNDCAATINPGSFDFPGNSLDEDCSGKSDDWVVDCDSNLELDGWEPLDAAKSLGLCNVAAEREAGLLRANFMRADGSRFIQTIGRGILPHFGPNVSPRAGARMLALSSGAARNPEDPNYYPRSSNDTFGDSVATPAGYPMLAPACAATGQSDVGQPLGLDSSGLELVLRVPSNARALSFDFNFYTFDYPKRVCSRAADQFVVLVDPPPSGAHAGNVAFDAEGAPMSVNNQLIRACDAASRSHIPVSLAAPHFSCPLGTNSLTGTGYEVSAESGPHAATGWLVTRIPVAPNQELRIRFLIWDAEDFDYDSLVLLDRLTWHATESTPVPVTTPVE
jgi:hypothetical protein